MATTKVMQHCDADDVGASGKPVLFQVDESSSSSGDNGPSLKVDISGVINSTNKRRSSTGSRKSVQFAAVVDVCEDPYQAKTIEGLLLRNPGLLVAHHAGSSSTSSSTSTAPPPGSVKIANTDFYENLKKVSDAHANLNNKNNNDGSTSPIKMKTSSQNRDDGSSNITTMQKIQEKRRSSLALDYQKQAAAELLRDQPNWGKIRRLIQLCEFQLMHTDPDSGNTTLHRASYFGAYDIVKLCVNQKAPINQKNSLGRTPLMLAAEQNEKETVMILIEARADVSIETMGGATVLHLACQANAFDVVQVLLDRVPDLAVNAEDNNRRTPSQYTTDERIQELLTKHSGGKDNPDDLENLGVFKG